MKKFLFPVFLFLTGINVFFASWSVLHNDIFFLSDIARDMFLLQEIVQKKLVLIGPRSSVSGLFHGPLWSYLNLPGYVLGQGNPVAVGWYWVFLIIVFLVSSYFIAKRLFNRYAAMLFVLFTSLYLAYHSNNLFNPTGAMFVMPTCFYFFVRYVQTQKVKFLLYHLITVGAMIQFQMAIGAPLLILSFLYTAVFSFKKHHLRHMLLYLIIPLLLSNFILFNFKHNFILTDNMLRHLGTHDPTSSWLSLISNRIDFMFNGLGVIRFGPPHMPLIFVSLLLIFVGIQIKQHIHQKIYELFLYFFVGFFVVSLINRYGLLEFYVFPILSLLFLIFGSLVTGKYKKAFLLFFAVIYILNTIGLFNYVRSLQTFIGRDQYSWNALYNAASVAYRGDEKEFGYFIYSPDILGYGPRYAMEYARRATQKNGYAFEKKPTTYLLIEPAARDNIFTSEEIFKLYKAHIYSAPTQVWKFDSGYKLEKYILTTDDYLPFDEGINPGLHYR